MADVSVSVVNIAVDTTDGVEQYAIEFMVSPDTALPIAQGTGNAPLPTGCNISSLEFNTPSGWAANNFSGFTLVERNSETYLEVRYHYTVCIQIFKGCKFCPKSSNLLFEITSWMTENLYPLKFCT